MKPRHAGKRWLAHLGLTALALAVTFGAGLPTVAAAAPAQCTPVLSGLRLPVGSLSTDAGNLLIAEAGDGTSGSGRISIVDRNGSRRTLLEGMPSAPADVGDPSGPSGLYMGGRSLFVTIGTGDTGILGPRPGTTLANPAGPSSPIFSSVLEIFFSAQTEARTTGFTMTPADEKMLAKGQPVRLRDSRRNDLFIRMVTDFPNAMPRPLPDVPDNIDVSNPFGIVGLGPSFYVNDGGRNLTWRVNGSTGAAVEFANYPDIPNPLFGMVGGPFIQAVPTGIGVADHQLLVSLFRGAPFATGVSDIEAMDPSTGTHAPFIEDLTTAIGTLSVRRPGHRDLLVLEMAATGPFFAGPGTVLRFKDFGGAPETLASCLVAPTSMAFDKWTHALYVTESEGNLVSIPLR